VLFRSVCSSVLLAGCENCPHAELWRSARREWLTLSGGDPETPLALVQL
jgi:hypothetical protein